jgi:hypothetical protein
VFDQITVPLKGSLNLEDVQQERSLQPSAVDSAAPTAELHLHCPFFGLNRLFILLHSMAKSWIQIICRQRLQFLLLKYTSSILIKLGVNNDVMMQLFFRRYILNKSQFFFRSRAIIF